MRISRLGHGKSENHCSNWLTAFGDRLRVKRLGGEEQILEDSALKGVGEEQYADSKLGTFCDPSPFIPPRDRPVLPHVLDLEITVILSLTKSSTWMDCLNPCICCTHYTVASLSTKASASLLCSG